MVSEITRAVLARTLRMILGWGVPVVFAVKKAERRFPWNRLQMVVSSDTSKKKKT